MNAAWPPTRSRIDEAADLPLRRHLPLRLSRVRATAARARGAVVRGRVPAGAVRRHAGALGPEGPGRDRAEARLDLPPRALAGALRRRAAGDAGAASVQSARA